MKPHTKNKTRGDERNATPYSSLTSSSYHRHVQTRYRAWQPFRTKPEIKSQATAFSCKTPRWPSSSTPAWPHSEEGEKQSPRYHSTGVECTSQWLKRKACHCELTVNQHEGDSPSSWACLPTLKADTPISQSDFSIYALTVRVAWRLWSSTYCVLSISPQLGWFVCFGSNRGSWLRGSTVRSLHRGMRHIQLLVMDARGYWDDHFHSQTPWNDLLHKYKY